MCHDTKLTRWAFMILMAALFMAGCKTKYVMVPEYHTEYVCRTDSYTKIDSVHLRDSVYIFQKGDTVYKTKVSYKDNYKYIYKAKSDTIIKRDSIPYPVERQLTKGEQRLMSIGRAAIILMVCCFLFFITIYIFLYHKRKY